ncbi:MAG: flagellar motor switch protein FliM [Deltaproteobacteria bacterium]|nr:flagellar motor switch protein FliM [Deltaproteobacteria bacterium]
MDQILSKNEVDALLSAVNEGIVATEDEKDIDPTVVRSLDLTSQDRISRQRLPGVESLAVKTANRIRTLFAGLFRRPMSVTLRDTELVKFGEILSGLGGYAVINLIKLYPLHGSSMLVIEPDLFLSMITLLFGGKRAEHVPRKGPELTPIEARMARKLTKEILEQIEYAFEGVVKLDSKYINTEVIPRFAPIAITTDLCLQIKLRVELDEERSGDILLVIPYSALDPIKDKLKTLAKNEESLDANWRNAMLSLLVGVDTDVWAELGRTEMRVQDLLELQVGDVLLLDTALGQPAKLFLEGRPKYRGLPVKKKGMLAFKIDGAIKGDEE